MTQPFTLPRPERRARGVAILPLINVVFLLLMFIVLAGIIRSPDPFALTPPQASQGEQANSPAIDQTVFVSPTGEVRFRNVTGEQAMLDLVKLLAARDELTALTLRADAGTSAAGIVRLVEGLRATGITQVHLQAERRP